MKIHVLIPEQGAAKAYFFLPPETQPKGTRVVVAEIQDFKELGKKALEQLLDEANKLHLDDTRS
jgi:hypothetical protein